jgi:peptidoglycan-N-acetylglucosamine deacetylase
MRNLTPLVVIFLIVVFGGVVGSAPLVPQRGGYESATLGPPGEAIDLVAAHAHPAIAIEAFDPARGLPPIERFLWNPARSEVEYPAVELWRGGVLPRATVIPGFAATPERRRMVALTFDDGPSPAYTPAVLRILRAMNVKATFCVVGWMSRRHPELVAAIHNHGHALCNHTEHHMSNFAGRSRRIISSEIVSAADLVQSITGIAPAFYRSPGGSISAEVLKAAQKRGMRVLGWSVDPHDFRNPPAALIVSNVMTAVRPGAIILLHDGGSNRSATVQALPELIRALRGEGYGFRTP